MAKYMIAREMDKFFSGFEVGNVRRSQNEESNSLTKVAAGQCPLQREVFHEELTESSVAGLVMAKKVLTLGVENWRAPIRACLENKLVDENKGDEQRVRFRATCFL